MTSYIVPIAILFVLFIMASMLSMAGFIKKNKIMQGAGCLLLIVITGLIFYFVSTLFMKGFHAFDDYLTRENPTFDATYARFYGKPKYDCVKYNNYADSRKDLFPDSEILLHYRTCPEELNRILRRTHYTTQVMPGDSPDLLTSYKPDSWFAPHWLGKEILVFGRDDTSSRVREYIYSNLDSTKVYSIHQTY